MFSAVRIKMADCVEARLQALQDRARRRTGTPSRPDRIGPTVRAIQGMLKDSVDVDWAELKRRLREQGYTSAEISELHRKGWIVPVAAEGTGRQ